jgi:hypothetical protein
MTIWRSLSGQSRSKLKNKRCDSDGYSFASKLEASVYQMLKLRKMAGEILSIQPQVRVRVCGPLGHDCREDCKVEYIVDFKCETSDGSFIFVEAKGVTMPAFAIKRRLWKHNNLGRLEIWKGTAIRPFLSEIIG